MSQHSFRTRYQGDEVVVVAGYDRPLNDLFLQVLAHEDAPQATEKRVLYSSIHDASARLDRYQLRV